MSLSLVQSRALLGLEAAAVTVEVHLANGLPSFTLVGLADVEVKEARERVRSAIHNAGLEFPSNKRITVNLAPADLPKDSGRFDLPIALGILAASGQIDPERLAGHEFAGELSLSGHLRPVRGALAMALALHTRGVATRLVLPADSAQEAALVPDAVVYGAQHLLDVVGQFLHQPAGSPEAPPAAGWTRVAARPAAPPAPYADLADVKGHAGIKRALEIAAAGQHGLLMVGPPGSGKSMLAQRFAGLLPPMTVEEALESAAIASLGGRFTLARWMVRPTASPHHTASAVALVGGGSPPRPGEISLAHQGVLFLDEFPEFARAALEALREPLETGTITISRAARRAEFPARFQLIAAMNPCPCGHLGSALKACRCTPEQVARYQGVGGHSYCALATVIDISASQFMKLPAFSDEISARCQTSMPSRCTGGVIRSHSRWRSSRAVADPQPATLLEAQSVRLAQSIEPGGSQLVSFPIGGPRCGILRAAAFGPTADGRRGPKNLLRTYLPLVAAEGL